MSTSQHKNIVPEYVSFVDKHFLWIVMPIMDAGSCQDIIKLTSPDGVKDEAVIATILKETLEGI